MRSVIAEAQKAYAGTNCWEALASLHAVLSGCKQKTTRVSAPWESIMKGVCAEGEGECKSPHHWMLVDIAFNSGQGHAWTIYRSGSDTFWTVAQAFENRHALRIHPDAAKSTWDSSKMNEMKAAVDVLKVGANVKSGIGLRTCSSAYGALFGLLGEDGGVPGVECVFGSTVRISHRCFP